jgi:hypothetical protein
LYRLLRVQSLPLGSDCTLTFLVEHDLFGKPASTFPDHALRTGGLCYSGLLTVKVRSASMRS